MNGVQKIVADQGWYIDDPIILKAIEDKALMIFIQGQSVKAINGVVSNDKQETMSLEGALLKELSNGKSLQEIEKKVRIFLVKYAFSQAGESIGRHNRAAKILGCNQQMFSSMIRRLKL